jgi:hypothetical protein
LAAESRPRGSKSLSGLDQNRQTRRRLPSAVTILWGKEIFDDPGRLPGQVVEGDFAVPNTF